MKDYTISVIVPVYNVEEYLEKCIDSLLNQTQQGIEIILVDDGSTDDSPRICDDYANKYNNIICVHKENGGVSSARNAGLRIAHGDYIGFVDSDDWIEQTMYEKLVYALDTTGADVVGCGVIQETVHGSFPDSLCDDSIELYTQDKAYGQILLSKGMRGYLCNKLFKKELITEYIDESINQCEDLLFNANYLRNVKKAAYVNLSLYHYLRNDKPDSYSYNNRSLTLMDAYEKVLLVYMSNASHYESIVEANMLKIYLNFRCRYVLTKDRNVELWNRINGRVSAHMKNVLFSKSVSFSTKFNIIVTYLFPKTMIRIKKSTKQIRHKSGKWES